MTQETAEIKRNIQRKRHEIDEDIARLREELFQRMDWRWQVRSRPFTALGVALACGLFAGFMVTR
ncbi:MAG: hypothetical protein HYX94_04685 [Chloroflexi bacterium]|nr:hypothetical protein [Chloroflexota bacterium]